MKIHFHLLALPALLYAGTAVPAVAQTETLLIQPILPDDFDRGRNISVQQRSRPDYEPTGVRAGSFNVFPEVGVATGYSSNIYYSDTNETDDGYITVSPAVRITSDWSRHQLTVQADTQIQRFFSQSRRNQTPWNIRALGALEVGSGLRIIPEVQIARQFETPFSGEINTANISLSNYLRKYAGVRGEYSSGQAKFTLAVDDTDYAFSDIKLSSGTVIDQQERDRNLLRTTGQVQYAFTPSIAAYAQINYTRTNYDSLLLSGLPNRDSDGYRIIGGFNFDLSGLLRGTIGIGYARRNFDSAIYRNVDGFSAEGKLEYFPTELTTITLGLRRVIEDSNIASTNAFFDNRASLSIDHELLRNLILNASGEIARQNYIGVSANADVYRVGAGATYLSSNWLKFNMLLAYTGRSTNSTILGRGFDEYRGQIGVTFRR